MKRWIVFEKRVGETPLSVIDAWKRGHPEYENVPMAYAGRLDPMASGKLLVLVGDECKKQKNYQNLDKSYDFEILFNFTSDTGDVLGIADYHEHAFPNEHALAVLSDIVDGELALPYPHYSSKTVRGKPLFLWTLEGRIHEIQIPTKFSHLYRLSYRGSRLISATNLYAHIQEKIESIPEVTEPSKALGQDFRRDIVRRRWRELFERDSNASFMIARFSATVSSGTYIRSLAPLLAEKVGATGLAFSIHRTRIGRYMPIAADVGFWRRTFR